MKRTLSVLLAVVVLVFCAGTAVFAKTFAPSVNMTNVGIRTQYLYQEYDETWLRKLVIKESLYTLEGLADEKDLFPVTDYPYRTDAPCFRAEVAQNVELFTLSKDSQRAAYLYVLDQLGAATVISEPTVDGKTKADWLRAQGIVVTEEDETDREKVLMISALYALMKNDFYYVYKGERLDIPKGTPLEEATVMYLVAMSGQDTMLSEFIQKHFGKDSYGNLEDYIFYTSLMALYTGGYVRADEISTLTPEEVNRRVAIMTINTGGIAIDGDNATDEEITLKYLTAMLNKTYEVTLEPASVEQAQRNKNVAYYILQEMAYEDKKIAITPGKYTYDEAFNTVLLRTDRFKLEDDFYADIFEYNVYLDNTRDSLFLNPVTLYATDDGTNLKLFINDTEYMLGNYSQVALDPAEAMQTLKLQIFAPDGHGSTYTLHVYQSPVAPSGEHELTGLLPTTPIHVSGPDLALSGTGTDGQATPIGSIVGSIPYAGYEFSTYPAAYSLDANGQLIDSAGKVVETLANGVIGILRLNDKNQLVDVNGNLISPDHYDPLPVGYQYVLDNNGNVNVYVEPTETAPTTAAAPEPEPVTWRQFAVPLGAGAVILLLGIVLLALLNHRRKDPLLAAERMKARRLRQRKKRAKAEEKAARKDVYNKRR